ncbi:uncharacterized protein LOC127261126 [Andrographis paniculata]|uniref:uncharacterized protein LOC127261126 n=1 Tax=Andrographis paniculata TaxID=175694 RepID=UPI0021E96842|nr:uncharacterized protein LOC127261126 [Andrographis paniculata]
MYTYIHQVKHDHYNYYCYPLYLINYSQKQKISYMACSSLGGGDEAEAEAEAEARKKQAMWVSPNMKVKMMMGANCDLQTRWGHSSCYFNASLYIFGGCRGGVHFSDVLVCNLRGMTWNILETSGEGPGPRDSHSAVMVDHRMLIFGGTNGCKKVNDLHILDLLSRKWTCPDCRGTPPPPRESHTATVVNDKLVIFGGSGEGGSNYLNDVHILDLKRMEWSAPEVRGSIPAARDSHSSVGVGGGRMLVFGGDSGDRYQGDVSVLHVNTMRWSRLEASQPGPGARAGHASVSIGTKVYVLGGVGDKKYYNDVWVLDVVASSWSQLHVYSQKPSQGRFSHTATITNLGVAVFGGCGEDEQPLNELLILQMETEMLQKKDQENNTAKAIFVSDDDEEEEEVNLTSPSNGQPNHNHKQKQSFRFTSDDDMLHPKRRRTRNSTMATANASGNDCSFRSPSPLQCSCEDHIHIPLKKTIARSRPRLSHRNHDMCNYYLSSSNHHIIKQEGLNVIHAQTTPESRKRTISVGAEVHGHVDGQFDSGFLMTATVNGNIFRGVLFAPGQGPARLGGGENRVSYGHTLFSNLNSDAIQIHSNVQQQPPSESRRSPDNVELDGVVLTLASPSTATHP